MFYLSLHKKHLRYDRFMLIASLIMPIMTLPQAVLAWSSQDASISLVSWSAYTLFAILWFCYGVFHRDKIIIISNGASACMNTAVLLGILI